MAHRGFGTEPRLDRSPRSLYADEPDEDRLSALFNEALYQVAWKQWGKAEATLGQLLELVPDDGEALVLLAKVYVARGRLDRALGALDAARDVAWPVDPGLRQAVLDRLHYSLPPVDPEGDMTPSAPPPGVRDAVAARQQSFVLRQDNLDLHDKVTSLEREVRRWIFATMGVCITATALVTWSFLPDLPAPETPPTLAAAIPIRRIFPTAPEAPTPLGHVADGVVPNISTNLQARVEDGVAIAQGELADFRELTAIDAAWLELPHVERVDWSQVIVTSRLGGRVLVRPGDTLSQIAFRYYGDPSATGPIERANGVTSATLRPGAFLSIPAAE